jgi:hypothetical protein
MESGLHATPSKQVDGGSRCFVTGRHDIKSDGSEAGHSKEMGHTKQTFTDGSTDRYEGGFVI